MSANEIREIANEVRYARDDVRRSLSLPQHQRAHCLRGALRRLDDAAKRLDDVQREALTG